MRKFRSKSEGRDGYAPSAPKSNMRSAFLLLAIAALALTIRVVFAWDAAVSDGFAFSGSSASYHHKVITALLETGTLIASDPSLNFPLGSTNPNPPGFDLVAAAVALVGTTLGMAAPKAANIALLSSSPVLGTLSVVVAYFLGKEVFGKKSAGMLAALFVALCPAAITQTVLSNGTEIPLVLFLSLLMAVFAFRAVSAIPQDTESTGMPDMLKSNRAMLFNSAMAGLAFLCIMLSWGAYRPLLLVSILSMVAMVVADRFTGRDPRPTVVVFALIVALPSLLAIPVHMWADLWEPVMFGNTALALICVALCFGFAMARKLPWTLTVPAFAAVAAALFVYFGMFADGILATIVHGGSVAPSGGRRIQLSMLSTMFGWATIWFGWALVALRLYRLPANKDSRPYLFLPVWMVAMMAMGWENEALAALSAPAYALGFAGILVQLFHAAGIYDYYQSFKGVDAKTFLRRLVKPIPLGAVLVVALLVVAPNGMYAIDSGISYNDKAAYNEKTGVEKDLFGSIGYYVEGKDAKERSDFFESLAGMPKSGAMVTGQSNVVDASSNGFDSVSDTHGNGLAAASHILLSNGGNGEAIAAMMYRIVSSKGGIADFKAQLTAAGLSDADYDTLLERDRDVAGSRGDILSDPDRYGKFRPDIDDESVRYVAFKKTLVEKYNAFQIAQMYDAVCAKAGAKITYVAVSGDMLPLSMQSQAIVSMYAAGYHVDSSAKAQFINVFQYGQQTYFNGVKDTIAETALWRAVIGLVPSEGKSAQSLLNSVGDGTAEPTPGNGVSCFKVIRWDIKYNPEKDAKYDTDGWVVLPASEALAEYNEKGGTIGHISSLPVVLEYVSPAGNCVSGIVAHDSEPVEGIEVSTIDAEGKTMSAAFTDKDGWYVLPAIGGETEVRFRAGVHDGEGISLASKPFAPLVNHNIPLTSYEGMLVPHELIDALIFKGKVSGKEYGPGDVAIDVDGKVSIASIVPDFYDVEIVRINRTVKTVPITVFPGPNAGHEIKAGNDVTITVKGPYGETPAVDKLRVTSLSPAGFDRSVDVADGKAEANVPSLRFEGTPGREPAEPIFRYRVSVTTAGFHGQAEFSADEGSVSVTCYPAVPLIVDAGAANVLYDGYVGTPVGDDARIPRSEFGLGSFTLYGVKGNKASITVNDAPQAFADAHWVRGKLKATVDEKETNVKGTVGFIRADGAAVYVPATDSGYGVLLPDGVYHVYAFSTEKKEAHFGKVTVAGADLEADFDMRPAREATGTVKALEEKLRYVAVTVTAADIEDFPKLILSTDNDGKYSVVLPNGKGAKAEVTATDFTGTKSKTVSASGWKFGDISLKKRIAVTNNTGYELKMGDVTIAVGETKNVEFSDTILDDSDITNPPGAKIKWSDSAAVRPDMAAVTFKASSVVTLYSYTVEGMGDNPVFTIVPTDEGRSESSGKKAYLEDGREFTITVKSDGRMEMVKKTLVAPAIETLTPKESLTVKAYVGALPEGSPGTLDKNSRVYTVYNNGIDDIEIDFKKKDGVYSAAMPHVGSVTVTAEFTYKFSAEGVTRGYEASETRFGIADDAKEVMVNLSLRNDGAAPLPIPSEGEKVTATFDGITGMDATNPKESEVVFRMTVNTDATEPRTLSLSGANWASIRFYDDGALTQEIVSVSIDDLNPKQFHAVGVYDGTAHAAGDLKVVFSNLEGDKKAEGSLAGADADPAWDKTTPKPGSEPTRVGKDPGIAAEYEYYHAVKLINEDNYAKTFNVKAAFDADPKWLTTFVTEDGRTMEEVNAAGNGIDVPGNGTLVVYVKFTSAFGEKTSTPKVKFEVTCPGFDIFAEGDGVEIVGQTAKLESVSQEVDLGIKDASASGRGVFNEDGKIPGAVWALVAGIVVMIVLTVWMGMRRGVFTRRK